MANINKPEDPSGHVRNYGAYQNEVYAQGMFHNILPTITKDPNKLEAHAKEALSSKSYSYVAGGAGERATMDANRLAFRQWKVHDIPFNCCQLGWEPPWLSAAPTLELGIPN
jgi:lactate 2-monooxygenase